MVKNVVVSHNDVSEIFWNILGDEYEENIKDFEVKGHEVDSTEQWARQNKLDATTGGVHNYHGDSSNLLSWFRNNAFGFR